MSLRLLVLFAFMFSASVAFAQNAPASTPAAKPKAAVPASPSASEVPAPPPASAPTPTGATPAQAPATPAPQAPAPQAPAPGAPQTAGPQTPAPQPPPAGSNELPPPPTFPQGAQPASTPPAQVTGYGAEQEALSPPPKLEPLGMFGLTLSFGFAFGGEKLVAATFTDGSDGSITAGSGAQIGLGFVLTPLRTEGHSLGISVDQSAKFASISARNADITLTRFPLVAALRYGYAFNDTWNFIAGGGMVFEYGISLIGSGDAEGLDEKFHSALGFMAEAGVAYRERSFLIDVTLRFTGLTYETDEVSDIDAKNGALVIAGHYFF